MMIKYIIIAILLLIIEILYIKIASNKGLKDIPNHRSAHLAPTVRGGGIIIPIAIIMFFLFYEVISESSWYLLFGLLIVAVISFIDDLILLSSKVRLIAHLTAFIFVFYGLNIVPLLTLYNIIIFIILIIFSIGFLNIYNFMDGINGITFLNALVTFLTLLYLNSYYTSFTDNNLLVIIIIALLVFGVFNFRKKALCFAGDIGSITVGFSLIYFVLKLYLQTDNIAVFLVFSVYLIDGGWTIVERIIRKENIFEAHKRHLYQLAVNDLKIQHLKISSAYFLAQLVINAVLICIIKFEVSFVISSIILFSSCSFVYILIKRKVVFQIEKNE